MILPRINPLKTKSWSELKKHFNEIKSQTISQFFANDSNRFKKFSIKFDDLLLDFSKNRLTEKTLEIFDKLAQETMKSIVKKFLLELNTMTVEKNVEVNANDDATEYLIEKGFDAKLGARPLARIIDNEIKKPLSRMILFGDLQEGGRVEVTVVDKKLKIKLGLSKSKLILSDKDLNGSELNNFSNIKFK